jgi:hypothetical protein
VTKNALRVQIEMAIMKSKKRKHGKAKKKPPEDFVRDDAPTGPSNAVRNHKSKKRTRERNGEDFQEYYY